MKRFMLLAVALGVMAGVTALALQNQASTFPYFEWANAAKPGKATTALVVEFGLRDVNVRDWSGTATVRGAKVVQREGYRFRAEDKLVGSDAWEAKSHRAIRGAKGNPVVAQIEPIASVGVVYHLQDVEPDAHLSIRLQDGTKAELKIADLAAGKTQTLLGGDAAARLITTAEPVAVSKTEDDSPAAAYAPDGTLWIAYVAYHVLEDERRIEPPMLKEQPADFKKYDTPRKPCQVFARSWKDGKWAEPIAVTGADQIADRVAIAVVDDGAFWIAYSRQHADGNFDLITRPGDRFGRLGPELQVSSPLRSDVAHLSPTMCTDAHGVVWLAYQDWVRSSGLAMLRLKSWGNGAWQDVVSVSAGNAQGGNVWHPVLAASPLVGGSSKIALVYDSYRNGNYDVDAHVVERRGASINTTSHRLAGSSKFEARPAAVYDKTGRLWIAYEEGPEQWGKDYGALDVGTGKPLYNERSVKVVCLEPNGQLTRPVAELPVSKYDPPVLPFEAIKTAKFERATRYAYPKIGLDGRGDVWVSYRQNFGTRYTTHPGPYWLTFARRLQGDTWGEPIEVHHSDGLLDHRPVLSPHATGGLLVVHNTDGRYTTPEVIANHVYASIINLPEQKAEPKLVAHNAGRNPLTPAVKAENEAAALMRNYRMQAGGKSYRFLRGEYHRHTEISWDGAPDGSLEDMFRYAIDAAKMDWIGNGDHDNGAGREYSWWLTQKATAAYYVPGKFTPMYTYERSVAYPHGHRNVMFDRPGIRTLPRLAPPPDVKKAEGGVHPDDTKMLYRYLRELGGICAVHTSATGMGTDWRDNDPVVEPIVEIYQGDRMSYEHEGAPRAGYDPKGDKEPGNVAGWFPKGFINLALQKGYKLGFQASSDHWSTHISFFIVLAEKNERTAILDAVKKRHCYAATDNIVVNFRCGEAIMGDEVTLSGPPTFKLHVWGTAPLAKIDVLRDSEVVATLAPKGASVQFQGDWTDPRLPGEGTSYYYVRALQTDGEIAWGSPIWVTIKK